MKVHLEVRNESQLKRLYRRDTLQRLAERVCEAEGAGPEDIELSVLFCDDPFIAALNGEYRGKRESTDVLSFGQGEKTFHGSHVLGDIVISLETVARFCGDEAGAMRAEVRLLFCHGLLHLLGCEHGTTSEEETMTAKQALYLDVEREAAWRNRGQAPRQSLAGAARGGAKESLGRRR